MNSELYIIGELSLDDTKESIDINHKKVSLLRSTSEPNLYVTEPFLLQFKDFADLYSFSYILSLRTKVGIIILSNTDFDYIYKHLRRFLTVQDEFGKRMFFKFYDPEVLRVFLPFCDTQQLKEFFGPIQSFIVEDENPAYGLTFSLSENYQLITKRVIKEEIFGQANLTTLAKDHITQE